MSEMTREEAINELTEALMEINPNDLGREEILRWAVALNMAIESLKEQRPHGKWLLGECWSEGIGMGENYGQYKICPFCGYKAKEEPRNFCAKCGADMRRKEGEDNETD